jgi:hypothetical protein
MCSTEGISAAENIVAELFLQNHAFRAPTRFIRWSE